MSQSTNQKKTNATAAPKSAEGTVEVLYQRLGNKWFAFSLIDDEVFVGSITDEAIQGPSLKAAQGTFENEGNS